MNVGCEKVCVCYCIEGRVDDLEKWLKKKKTTEKTDIPFQLTKETQTIRVNGSLKKIYKNNVLCHGS